MLQFRMFSCLILVVVMTISCNEDCIKGSGSIVTEVLDIDPFVSIRSTASFDVHISEGPEQYVEAVGHKNIIDLLDRSVVGGVWDMSPKSGCYKKFNLDIYITIPSIETIESYGSGDMSLGSFDSLSTFGIFLTGSGDVHHDGMISYSESVTTQSSGSGNIELDVNTKALSVSTVGSGNIQIKGSTITQAVSLTGSGDYRGFDMYSEVCSVSSTGSGNADVRVSDELDVSIAGSGDVSYKGRPSVNSNITGSGRLINAN